MGEPVESMYVPGEGPLAERDLLVRGRIEPGRPPSRRDPGYPPEVVIESVLDDGEQVSGEHVDALETELRASLWEAARAWRGDSYE